MRTPPLLTSPRRSYIWRIHCLRGGSRPPTATDPRPLATGNVSLKKEPAGGGGVWLTRYPPALPPTPSAYGRTEHLRIAAGAETSSGDTAILHCGGAASVAADFFGNIPRRGFNGDGELNLQQIDSNETHKRINNSRLLIVFFKTVVACFTRPDNVVTRKARLTNARESCTGNAPPPPSRFPLPHTRAWGGNIFLPPLPAFFLIWETKLFRGANFFSTSYW